MAEETKFPLTHIYQVDASKRTGHSNAAVIGFGKHQKIIIYDTLLKSHEEQVQKADEVVQAKDEEAPASGVSLNTSNPSQILAKQERDKLTKGIQFEVSEIKAIVAHELGHWHNND